MPVVMTQRTSICLSLLALLSSFPLSLGDATHTSGSSLIGLSSASEILDEFFKKQEIAGRKPPVWKKEAQAMISLVQGMKEDIDPLTQEKVNVHVRDIIELLQGDLDGTPGVPGLAAQQMDVKNALTDLKSRFDSTLGQLGTKLSMTKSQSTGCKTCRDNVTALRKAYYDECSDNDRHGGSSSSSSSSMSLLELGSPCPTECGKPSTADFELTSEAKQTYTCDFEAGETAKECVAKLWGKVEQTKTTLTSKYQAWARQKQQCEDHMARCARCNPLWDALEGTIAVCDTKRDSLYSEYCELQERQTVFCDEEDQIKRRWPELEQEQNALESEYNDLQFIKCVFERYLVVQTFTVEMVTTECPPAGTPDFFTSFAQPPGKLLEPDMDSSAVPKCQGAVAHSQGTTLYDMSGLINEFKRDGAGSEVTLSLQDRMYSPDASPSAAICATSTGR